MAPLIALVALYAGLQFAIVHVIKRSYEGVGH